MDRLIGMTAAVLLLFPAGARTEETAGNRIYTLEELFTMAEENETRLQVSKAAAEIASLKVKESRDAKLPDMSAGLSASFIGDGWISDRDFTNASNVPLPHLGNNFSFEATQVIYSGGALNAAEEMSRINEKIAKTDVELTRQQVRLMITGCYLDLFRKRNCMKVYENNAELMRRLVELGRKREHQGTALSNDVTRYELQLEEMLLALDEARTESDILNFRLCTMLDIPADTQVLADTTILEREYEYGTEDRWQMLAPDSPVMGKAISATELAEQKLKAAKSERIPRIAITAADHLDGPVLIEVPALNNNFNYWYIGIGLKIDLGAIYKSASRIRQAKTGISLSREQQRLVQEELATEIQAAYRKYLHSFTELETQTKNVQLADENYRTILKRYENGLALVTDMTDAANMKLTAELAQENARIQLIYNYHQLKYSTGTI